MHNLYCFEDEERIYLNEDQRFSLGHKVKLSEAALSCPTLCDPMDCSPPGFSVHGISQARILELVAVSFSRGSSQPRDQTQVSRIAGRHFNSLSHQGSPLLMLANKSLNS